LYIPTLIWAGLTLLIAIQAWWASFGMRTHANWTFVALLVILLQAISWYMVAALVLPDISGDAVVDLREHYFAHKNWFFAVLQFWISRAAELLLPRKCFSVAQFRR
jgi:hypothetical protein